MESNFKINDNVEVWNRVVNSAVNVKHPSNFWFISHFNESQKHVALKVEKNECGRRLFVQKMEVGIPSQTRRSSRVKIWYWQNWYYEFFIRKGSQYWSLYTFIRITNNICFQSFVFPSWETGFFFLFYFVERIQLTDTRLRSPRVQKSRRNPHCCSFM